MYVFTKSETYAILMLEKDSWHMYLTIYCCSIKTVDLYIYVVSLLTFLFMAFFFLSYIIFPYSGLSWFGQNFDTY